MRIATKRLCLLLSMLVSTTGCFQTCYLMQATYGQDEISYFARPLDEVVADERQPPRVRALLAIVPDVKAYGERHGLAPTGSYHDYVALDREAVVWVVSASQPLRFESATWSFPIIGSVPYLGYFRRAEAETVGAQLRELGLDVDVRGSSAYSTLGWFDDPVLSTMIREGPQALPGLVNVVLHESVHATHYVNSQSSYNESLADFVADTLTPDYLRTELGWSKRQTDAYQEQQRRGEERALRMHQTYLALDTIYRSERSDEQKLAVKQLLLRSLQAELGWPRPINNATLAQARTYHGAGQHFGALFRACGHDWRRFWDAMKTVGDDSFSEPQQVDVAPVLQPLHALCSRQ